MSVTRPPFVPFVVPVHGRRRAKYFVFHTTEGGGTVESLAAYFRRTPDGLGVNYIIEPSGRMGSNGDFDAMTYHVADHNSECMGVEQIATHTWTSEKWFTQPVGGDGPLMLWASAWLAAYVSQERDIPLRAAASNHRWTAPSGFTQHSEVPDNDHTDCGPGFPFGWVLGRAQAWLTDGVPAYVRDEILKARG